MRAVSVGTAVAGIEDHPEGAHDDGKIKTEGSLAGVVEIKDDPLLITEIVAAGNLPKTGEAWTNGENLLHAIAIAG